MVRMRWKAGPWGTDSLGVVQILDQECPDLSVSFLEEEGETVLGDDCLGP